MSFTDSWDRIKKETNIKYLSDLAEVIETSQPNVSRQKKEKTFPPGWAYIVGKKYGLLTEWIMTGEGPKRLGEKIVNDEKEAPPKGIIEEWIQEVREKEGNDGRIVMELTLQVEEFRTWFQEHKSKASLGKAYEKKSEAA